jgi:hypothetical protein
MPGDAALDELLVAEPVDELLVAEPVDPLFVVAPETEPNPPLADAPLARSLCDVLPAKLAAARLALDPARKGVVDAPVDEVVVVVGLEAVAPLVELVAMLSIVAPRPALPADALPLDEALLLPLLGGETAVTVGVLVRVAPAVPVAEALVPVLVKVWPDVTCED